MNKQVKFAGLMTVILGLAATSYATAQGGSRGARYVTAAMNGYQEVNSISTTGDGRFIARIDDDDQLIYYRLSYWGLEGATTTQSHIHFAQRSVNGAVHAFLCGGGDKPRPATEGTVTGVIDAADILATSRTGESKPGRSTNSPGDPRRPHLREVHTDKLARRRDPRADQRPRSEGVRPVANRTFNGIQGGPSGPLLDPGDGRADADRPSGVLLENLLPVLLVSQGTASTSPLLSSNDRPFAGSIAFTRPASLRRR